MRSVLTKYTKTSRWKEPILEVIYEHRFWNSLNEPWSHWLSLKVNPSMEASTPPPPHYHHYQNARLVHHRIAHQLLVIPTPPFLILPLHFLICTLQTCLEPGWRDCPKLWWWAKDVIILLYNLSSAIYCNLEVDISVYYFFLLLKISKRWCKIVYLRCGFGDLPKVCIRRYHYWNYFFFN